MLQISLRVEWLLVYTTSKEICLGDKDHAGCAIFVVASANNVMIIKINFTKRCKALEIEELVA